MLQRPRIEEIILTRFYRRVSAAMALAGINAVGSAALWSYMRQPRAGKRGLLTIGIMTFLLAVIASYRLSAVNHWTDALDSMEPGSQNHVHSKALFYVLHAAPEWLIKALILTVNVRKTFGTGPFGDWRIRDETPEAKTKRLEREGKHAAKKAVKGASELSSKS